MKEESLHETSNCSFFSSSTVGPALEFRKTFLFFPFECCKFAFECCKEIKGNHYCHKTFVNMGHFTATSAKGPSLKEGQHLDTLIGIPQFKPQRKKGQNG